MNALTYLCALLFRRHTCSKMRAHRLIKPVKTVSVYQGGVRACILFHVPKGQTRQTYSEVDRYGGTHSSSASCTGPVLTGLR